MKNTISLFAKTLFVALAITSFVSCAEDFSVLLPDANVYYTRDFITKYGLIDQSQDWNAAVRQNVTVNVDGPSRIKVYAWINGKYYIVANYADVNGKQVLPFDVPKGTKQLVVANGNDRRKAAVGDVVDFTVSSRANSTTAVGGTITITELTDYDAYSTNWLRMKKEGVMAFNDMIPENIDNRDKIICNFLYESIGPFILHPVFYKTSHTNTLGIYYLSNDADAVEIKDCTNNKTVKIKRIPVYTIKSDNTVLMKNSATSDNVDASGYINKNDAKWSSFSAYSLDEIFDWDSNTQLMSKGIMVDIPVGMQFGMYIQLDGGDQYFYSQNEFNPDPYYTREYRDGQPHTTSNVTKTTRESYQACHAGTFIGKEYGGVALTFEDWSDQWGESNGNGSDMDMNDMVFVIFGAGMNKVNPNIIDLPNIPDFPFDDNPYQWVIAAEDLGTRGDNDFNDVVVGVEYVAGETTAYLTPLAAGGTLPVKLMYNGRVIPSIDGYDQFHRWFKGNPPTTKMINTTKANEYESKGRVPLDVPSNFSIATLDNNGNIVASYADGYMGGFSILVEREDGTFDKITPPGVGNAPQMMCLPGGWAWPKESADIAEAYNRFSYWVASADENNDWYKSNYNTNLLIGVPNYVDTEPTK